MEVQDESQNGVCIRLVSEIPCVIRSRTMMRWPTYSLNRAHYSSEYNERDEALLSYDLAWVVQRKLLRTNPSTNRLK